MGLSFIIAAGPRQRSHSRVRVLRDSWPYFNVSFDTSPTWKTRSPYLYPPGRGWHGYTPRHWVPFSSRLPYKSQIQSYGTTDGQPASLSWNKAPIWGLRPDLYYLCDSCGLVLVGRPLWREDGSVVCNCYWSLPAQSFLGPSPIGLVAIF
jgi:hypothetical protein